MPLVYQQNINAATKLGVWHIAEEEDFFLQHVPLQKEITHPHKRLQHLAGRYLLRELFDDFPLELIKIADTKKPFLENEAYHFSISHCGEYAGVIVSSVNRVGADIEVISQKVERIKDKFLSAGEQKMMQGIFNAQYSMLNTQLTAAWSIKEAIFKWYGLGKVDFREHMQINKIAVNANEFMADCSFLKERPVQLKVHGLLFNNNVLAWVLS